MISKDYYRLNELQRNFGIFKEDLDYLIAETNIKFCLYCKTSDLILGIWQEGKFIGFGACSYSGLLSLYPKDQTEIFEKKSVRISFANVVQKEKVKNFSNKYPFDVETPNPIIHDWHPFELSKVKREHIPCIFRPQEWQKMQQNINALLNNLKIDIKELRINSSESEEDKLCSASELFRLKDVCITRKQLEKSLILLGKINTTQPKHSISNNNSKRQIDQLLIRLMENSPDAKPAELWSELEEDCNRELRLFDTDEILDEVGKKELFWFDLDGDVLPLKRRSFYNLIKKLKNS